MFQQNKPKQDPPGNALAKSILFFVLSILCLFLKQWYGSLFMLGIGILWLWMYFRIKKRFDKAIEKRKSNMTQMYGADDDDEDDDEEDDDEYF